MTDRREAVAKAIHEATQNRYSPRGEHVRWEHVPDMRKIAIFTYADAAIAAMQTEPTEAEIDAAYRAYENVPEWLDDDLSENEKDRIGIRAALIAVRKVNRHE